MIMELTVLPVAIVFRNILNLYGLSCLQHFIYQEWGKNFLYVWVIMKILLMRPLLSHNENITMLNYSEDIFFKGRKRKGIYLFLNFKWNFSCSCIAKIQSIPSSKWESLLTILTISPCETSKNFYILASKQYGEKLLLH